MHMVDEEVTDSEVGLTTRGVVPWVLSPQQTVEYDATGTNTSNESCKG